MSWFREVGGGISSITTQLTNLTKEVIAEGREEVSDHVTELSLAQQRTRELEIQCTSQKKEVERIHCANKELEERAHAAELQVNSTTKEYRSLLKQKEDEIRKLQQQQVEMQELQDKLLVQSKNANLASPSYEGSSCSAFADMDEMEFADVISSQFEINKLSDTVRRLRAERDQWKRLASSATSSQVKTEDSLNILENESIHQLQLNNKHMAKVATEPTEDQDHQDDGSLDQTLREKERTLQLLARQLEQIQGEKHELEQSQVEVGILQEAIFKLQKSETDLKEQLNSAQKTIQSNESLINQLQDEDKLKQKLEAAEMKISELLHERDQVCCDLFATKHRLMAQLDLSHANNSEMLLEVQLARHKFANKCDSKQMQLLKEKQDLANKMAQISEQSEDARGSVRMAEEENESYSVQVKHLLDRMGDAEHQQLIAGIIHALELENDVLKEQNTVLQKQLIYHDAKRPNKRSIDDEQRTSPSNRRSRSASADRSEDGSQQVMFEFDEFETSSVMSSYSELSQKNKELDEQLKMLQSQIDTHERDIEHFEMVKADWQVEKQTFGQLLDQLKNQLRAKESSFSVVTAQKGLLEVKKQMPRESSDSDVDFVLELEKLQEQIEELSQSSVQVEKERDDLLTEKETIMDDLYKANKLSESLKEKLTQYEDDESVKLKETIKTLEDSVSQLTTERDNLNRSLEELDSQHQTAVEHILESRTDMQNKYKQNQEELELSLTRVEDLQSEMDEYNEKLKEFDSIRNKLSTIETELEKAKNRNSEIEEKETQVVNRILSVLITDPEEVPQSDLVSYIEDKVEELRAHGNQVEKEKNKIKVDLENVESSRNRLEQELDSAKRALEALQTEFTRSKEEKTRSDWEIESWEDVVDDSTEKNGRENSLIKSTTKLQDLELESTSSKHSKDSSDDGQEKYGELVQRKEDLEIQVKDLETQVTELMEQKKQLESTNNDEELKTELESALKDAEQFKSMFDEVRGESEKLSNELAAVNNILKVYKENIDLEKMEDSAEKMKDLLKEKEIQVEKLKAELTQKGEIWWSEDEYRNLQHEREQILSVLDEKSRQNSSLKAEVHRLTSIVSAERSALEKLQEDTRHLLQEKESRQAEDSHMSKEAMQGLSRLLRDKELEIEALNQKNDTLIAILHQSPSTEDNQLESLLTERGNLTKQIGVLTNERQQIIAALNQKHEESVAYHAEIQRLSAALYTEHEKSSNLELQHSNVAKQYEDKQKTLINAQEELIGVRQRVTELEQQHLELKGKYAELLEKDEGEVVQVAKNDWAEMEEELDRLKKASRDKDEWLFEKDKLLREHQQRLERVGNECRRRDEEIVTMKRHIDSLNLQIGSMKDELGSSLRGQEVDRERVENATSETNILKETNSRLCLVVQEREFEITALKEKVVTLTRVVEQQSQSDSNNPEEMKRLLKESEAMQSKAQEFQQERDQALMMVNQKQQENKQINNQLQSIREREEKLHHELERLRAHLLQVEESYTQEAIHAEDREKELRNRLAQTEDRIRNTASSYTNASFQANVQVESLQQQLHVLAKQRDEALLNLDRAEDQTQQLNASLQTFQVVLEQFQQEKERDLAVLKSQHEEKMKFEAWSRRQLEYQTETLQHKLEEAKEALAAASRLSETLDQRDEVITSLKRE
uniref:Thyroid receptor-interacting protein 11 n=1 Tax=Strigamia maritima TaxID=126957 RepID=T1JGE6_STRMM